MAKDRQDDNLDVELGHGDRIGGKYLKHSGVGFEFAGAVAFFTVIGYFLGRHWGNVAVGVLVGALVGIAVGMYLIVKAALIMNREEGESRRK
ncbi:MAG: AtpZ/AtpI family protein [Phycisphaerae bacterium]|nr:AtpZ/AtpI family protein [Phycisphaerae bacterium]